MASSYQAVKAQLHSADCSHPWPSFDVALTSWDPCFKTTISESIAADVADIITTVIENEHLLLEELDQLLPGYSDVVPWAVPSFIASAAISCTN